MKGISVAFAISTLFTSLIKRAVCEKWIVKVKNVNSERVKWQETLKQVDEFINELNYFLRVNEWVHREDIDLMLLNITKYKKRIKDEIDAKYDKLYEYKYQLESNKLKLKVNESIIDEGEESVTTEEERMEDQQAVNYEDQLICNEGRVAMEDYSPRPEASGPNTRSIGTDPYESSSDAGDEEQVAKKEQLHRDASDAGGSSPNGTQMPNDVHITVEEDGISNPGYYESDSDNSTNTDYDTADSDSDGSDNGYNRVSVDSGVEMENGHLRGGQKRKLEEFEKLDVLPAKEVNRIRDEMEFIEYEIDVLQNKMIDIFDIEDMLREVKREAGWLFQLPTIEPVRAPDRRRRSSRSVCTPPEFQRPDLHTGPKSRLNR